MGSAVPSENMSLEVGSFSQQCAGWMVQAPMAIGSTVYRHS
jgi:hypothetical protein